MTNNTFQNYYQGLRLTFKGQFCGIFFFHVKPSTAILTTVSKTTFVKYRSKRELFTRTYFKQSVNYPKVSFVAKHPVSWNSLASTSPDFSCTR